MTTYARVIANTAVEIANIPDGFTLAQCFPAATASQFVTVPDGTLSGATETGGVWTNPTHVTPPAAPYLDLTATEFYLAFTPQERILIKLLATTGIPASGITAAIPVDPLIAEFWETFQLAVQTGSMVAPRLQSIQDGLAYLCAPNAPTPVVLSAGRAAQISQGIAQ
jgi:hypothetical protein